MKQKNGILAGVIMMLFAGLLFFYAPVYAAEDNAAISFCHIHTGDASNGGGCYGKQVTKSRECNSYNLSIWDNGQGSYNYLCRSCGYRWAYQYELVGPRCHNMITESYYEPDCGLGGMTLATLSCSKSQSGWAKELDLNACCQVLHDSFRLSATPYIWNGTASDSSVYHVTQNGNYTLGLQAEGRNDTSQVLHITIDHIDNQAPTIYGFSAESSGWCQSTVLSVRAEDTESGLHAQAYSYDGGATWTEQATQTVQSNGTYTVAVRDALGNISTAETVITEIDRTSPTVQVVTSPALGEWYDGKLTVTVLASDRESGLSESPYSFDGGESFLVGNNYQISSDSELHIVVTDKAGNQSKVTLSAVRKIRPQKQEGNMASDVARPVSGSDEETSYTGTAPSSGTASATGSVAESNAPETEPQAQNGVAAEGGMTGKKGSPEKKKEENSKIETEEKAEENEEQEESPKQHYPEEFWQGTPDTAHGGNGRKRLKEETEPEVQEESVILNELLQEREVIETHTVEQHGKGIPKKYVFGIAGLAVLLTTAGTLAGTRLAVIFAKDSQGRFRLSSIQPVRQKEQKKWLMISDTMLHRAQTNDFRIRMPILMKIGRGEYVTISCHGVSRELPLQKTLHVRLRGE